MGRAERRLLVPRAEGGQCEHAPGSPGARAVEREQKTHFPAIDVVVASRTLECGSVSDALIAI